MARASKRDELVQKALEIFYKVGFHATGMDRLVKETGISKTSMYKYFRTKDELILATLRLRDEQFRNFLMRRTEELADEPKEKLVATFDVLSEWFEGDSFRSCMFIKASSEYQDACNPIHATAAEHKRMICTFLTGLAEGAGLLEPENLARQLLLIQEGAIVIAHLHGPEQAGCDAKAAAITLIEAATPVT